MDAWLKNVGGDALERSLRHRYFPYCPSLWPLYQSRPRGKPEDRTDILDSDSQDYSDLSDLLKTIRFEQPVQILLNSLMDLPCNSTSCVV
jgi:hypothetical protein